MANPNQSVKTCILKVDLKCCTRCQQKESKKLKSISGVNEVEYNCEKGLMTVTGDVEPLALVRKLTKRGKKTELFSVKYQLEDHDLNTDDEEDIPSDGNRSHADPKTMERENQEKMKQKTNTRLLKKPSLLRCFSSNSKVVQPLPMQNINWHIPSKFADAMRPPPLRPPPPPMPYPTMMQQPPHVPMTGAPPYNVNTCQPVNQPYLMSKQAQTAKVNPKLHYQ